MTKFLGCLECHFEHREQPLHPKGETKMVRGVCICREHFAKWKRGEEVAVLVKERAR